MYVNSAGREKHEENIAASKFKGTVSTVKNVVYTLRIMELQEDDAGFYSCMFKTKNFVPAGYYIMPGGMGSALLLCFGPLPCFFLVKTWVPLFNGVVDSSRMAILGWRKSRSNET